MTPHSDRAARSSVRPAAYAPGRIVLTAVLVLAFMAIGLIAGKWQWGRYETRSAALAAQDRAAGLPTVPLASILTADDAKPGDANWRTVTVSGVISADVVQLRGRAIDTIASIQYLAWAHTADGQAVLLNLGWTPRAEPSAPLIPTGTVTVTGTVREFEADNGKDGTRINPVQMTNPEAPILPGYVMVASACGDGGCLSGVEPVPTPQLSTGPHLSYAMQWWLLLVAAAPIGIWLTVRDARLERERLALGEGTRYGDVQRKTPRPARRTDAKRERPSDEDVEDSL